MNRFKMKFPMMAVVILFFFLTWCPSGSVGLKCYKTSACASTTESVLTACPPSESSTCQTSGSELCKIEMINDKVERSCGNCAGSSGSRSSSSSSSSSVTNKQCRACSRNLGNGDFKCSAPPGVAPSKMMVMLTAIIAFLFFFSSF